MTLAQLKQRVEELRTALLFDSDIEELVSPPPRAEQDILQATAYLQLAACALQMADYHRMQGE